MIEALFNGSNYVAAKKMMDATALRQEAIASNLANLETPSYKRMDVAPSFRAELSKAISSGTPEKIAELKPQLTVDTTAAPQGRDGNTVQLENELMLMSQNSMAHAVETHMLTASLQRLRMAITGRS